MTIATRHLLTLSRRSPTTVRSASTAISTFSDPRFLKHSSPTPTPTHHTPILTHPKTRITTLPNRLRIATEPIPTSHTATVCVWVDTGSRFETEQTNGVAHFVEHMVMQGTGKRSSGDISDEFGDMGGELSGHTSREQTVYVAKVMAGDVVKAVEVLADMLQESVFDEKVIGEERNVIMDEFLEVIAQPEEVIFDGWHATGFQHTPLGRTILGPPKNIMLMTKKDMQEYLSTHYAAHRMVISVSGDVKHEDIVEQVNKLFTKLSTNPVTSAQLVEKEPALFTGSEIHKRDDDMPFAHFGIAFKGASWTDPDSVALWVIQTMLGSWNKASDVDKLMSSRLAQMAGIDELAESVRVDITHYKDTGLFGLYACAKPDCLHDLASAIMHEMSKLCYKVAEEDVIRAQNQLKYSFYKDEPTAVEIGRQLLAYGRIIPFAELFARIDAVDVPTIKRVANKFIFDQDIAIASSGPVKLLPDYNWFHSRTSMLHY